MSLFIASLNSGSNGNCYYLGNEHEAILVDAGISCRETEKRMSRLGLSMDKVKAIFVSHEHSDHIGGIRTLTRKYRLPVYITAATLAGVRFTLDSQLQHSFMAHEAVHIGGLQVTAFPKMHDASDPYSFVVGCGDVKVGIFTDIGIACDQLLHYFGQCHAAFLESNYDEHMLANGNYPYHLKKRISGGKGHLSNSQALEVFTKYRPPFMSHLVLSHLSRNNNHPSIVYDMFTAEAGQTHIVVASRYEETAVFHITAGQYASCRPVNTAVTMLKKKPVRDTRAQLSLF